MISKMTKNSASSPVFVTLSRPVALDTDRPGRAARSMRGRSVLLLLAGGLACAGAQAQPPAASAPAAVAAPGTAGLPGMPPLVDPRNVYSESSAGKVSPALAGDLERIYVPNLRSNDVYVVDPVKMKVVDRLKVGLGPQHIVPSWDLRTLWVTNNAEGRTVGSLTPIDPRTGKPGTPIAVDDPYNMYATPDGKSVIVVAEARKRLDFRDPKTMALQYSIDTPGCPGINHADFSSDSSWAIFTCEFSGMLAKVDLVQRKVLGYLKLSMPERRFKAQTPLQPGQIWEPGETELCTVTKGMPQDIRISPDGRRFYVADMHADGVHVVDAASFTKVGFIATGVGAHGLYPSRDGRRLFVANRGSHKIHGPRNGAGSVTVIDFASEQVVARWGIPGGGSPDMGNVSADGKWLWLAARCDDVIYRFDATSGEVKRVKVGAEPHGLTVWPQPGRYSLGHTGNMR
jgi:YVTN family beta-propeller protein